MSPQRQNNRGWEKNSLDILEEGMCLLRYAPGLLVPYYIGSLPFVAGALYFWSDMSQSIYGQDYLARASLGLTFLFIWMKFWQAVYAKNIFRALSRHPATGLDGKNSAAAMAHQTVIHATGFIIYPLAVLVLLPFAWVFAFYHNCSLDLETEKGLGHLVQRSWEQAKLWPRQNHTLLLYITLLYLVMFINICVCAYLIPQILKFFLGIDSVFILSADSLFNSTFLAMVYALTYLCVNPLVKAVYVLRYFYGQAIATGFDLKIQLDDLRKARATVMVLAIAGTVLSAVPVFASEARTVSREISAADSPALNKAIDEVLSRREFAWRIPRETVVARKPSGAFESTLEWLYAQFGKINKAVQNLFDKIQEFFRKLFPRPQETKPESPSYPFKWTRISLFALIGLLVAGLLVLAVVLARKKNSSPVAQPSPPEVKPQITDESIKADDRLAEEWLAMARELLDKGEMRFAVRAFYLATLSRLGKKQLLLINFSKSNREYERELKRRAAGKAEMCATFSASVLFLNSVWYGRQNPDIDDVTRFARDQEKIMSLADA